MHTYKKYASTFIETIKNYCIFKILSISASIALMSPACTFIKTIKNYCMFKILSISASIALMSPFAS